MHELSVCQSLLRIIGENLPDPRCRVTVVRLRIGRLSTIVPEIMRSSFEIAAQDTPAEGAELQIEQIPVTITCRACGEHAELDAPPIVCPHCGGTSVTVEAGSELMIDSFDVEDPEE